MRREAEKHTRDAQEKVARKALYSHQAGRERLVRGGRPGPPGCQGRLPFRTRINVRRFFK